MLSKDAKIFIAGHNGMVGKAITRAFKRNGYTNVSGMERRELNLGDSAAVLEYFKAQQFDAVVNAAAKVGGIKANSAYPADFIFQNLEIQNSIINAAHLTKVARLLFLGSSCIYPKFANQPIVESELLSGYLEPTNEPYAIAKIAGIKMCEAYNKQYGTDFRSAMPTNLYGEGDNYHESNSHVIPALLRRVHEAKITKKAEVVIWGTGSALREFLHVDDLANACIHLINIEKADYESFIGSNSHVNVGYGEDCSIKQLAELICQTVGFTGKLAWDASKPDGTPRKLLDSSLLQSSGWKASIPLKDGLQITYQQYLDTLKTGETRAV